MKKHLLLLLFLSFFSACSKEDNPTPVPPPVEPEKTITEKLQEAEWEVKVVAEEITYKYHHFDNLFSSNQSITVLEIDMDDEDVSVEIPYVTQGFIKTSYAAWTVGATAGINGSYFDTSKGGSTTFFKNNGTIINQTRSGFNYYREDAAFCLNAEGDPSVIRKPSKGWASLSSYPTLLASGPLLVINGEEVEQVKVAFNENRHPRTAVGVTEDNRLIAIVVDGRFSEAHGMTTKELAEVMHALGCVEAMNLDGGGSSTAWIKSRGVVNYPSDNKTFDHQGERGVATVLGFVIEE